MQFVSSWYTVEKYLKCYDDCVSPMSGEINWENIGVSGPKLPLYKKLVGRPKKQRRRNADEEEPTKEKQYTKKKMSRVGQIIKCRYCMQKDHNIRSC